ncbi:MAG: T9SS type A sorting domain-containing protein [Bacteroidota bacterium]
MKHLFLFLFSFNILLHAQPVKLHSKVINSAGWYQKGETLIGIHNIGESVSHTFANPDANLVLKQGFLQAEVSIHTGLDEDLQLTLSIYPNPTSQQLFVTGDLSNQEILTIYGLNGQVLIKEPLRIGEAISIGHLSAGIYQLLIIHPKTNAWYAAKLQKK